MQFGRGHAGQRDAIGMAEIDHCVAMRVAGDERLQFLNILSVGEMVKLNRIVLRIKVRDRIGADARCEHEIVIPRAAD